MPTTQGYDPGFVGAAYEAPDYLQDTQKSINWYPEISPDPHAKEPIALLGAPGTSDLIVLATGKQARPGGGWVLPGGTQMLAVCGANVYLITQSVGNLIANQVGTLLTPIGPVQIRDNGYVAVIVDGAYGYTYLLNTGAFSQITDPNFTGFASRIAMIDGWFIFNQANSRNFYISPQYLGINGNPNQGLQNTPWDATQFAVADATGDLLVSLIEDQRLIWLPKERATEVWYDAGAQFFTFNRMQGVLLQMGCAAPQSVARITKGLMWLAANERGQNFVIRTQGFDYDRVSTHAIDFAISSYATVSDAVGMAYIENGHEFYVLTFPTADVTWVYDCGTGLWHERLSFNATLGQYHRHRANFVVNFQNRRLIGTWDTGAIAWMDRSIFIDGPNPLVSQRRTGHIWDKQSRRRVFHHQLQIETSPGVGTLGITGAVGGSPGSGGSGSAANTILLMHFDGPNGSTSFVDSSGNGTIFSVDQGSPTISTTQSKFGGSSYLGATSGNPQIGIIGHNSILDIWQNDWTVEFFIYYQHSSNFSGCYLSMGATLPWGSSVFSYPEISFALNGGGAQWTCFFRDSSSFNYAGAFIGSSITPGTWTHIAFVRYSNVLKLYIDGVANATTWNLSTGTGVTGLTYASVGGARTPDANEFVPGYMDELRISNSAVYTSNFTPPTMPFTVGASGGVQNPRMILKWSDDGGKTFGNEKLMSMGQIGQYKNRAVAYNLGYSRDRVYDLRVIDAVNRDLIGATLMSETEQ